MQQVKIVLDKVLEAGDYLEVELCQGHFRLPRDNLIGCKICLLIFKQGVIRKVQVLKNVVMLNNFKKFKHLMSPDSGPTQIQTFKHDRVTNELYYLCPGAF